MTPAKLYSLAERYLAEGNGPKAGETLDQIDPEGIEELERLASTLLAVEAGAPEVGLKFARHLGEKDSHRVALAVALGATSQIEEALEVFRGLLNREEPNFDAFFVGRTTFEQGGALAEYLAYGERLKPKYNDHPIFWRQMLGAVEKLGDHRRQWAQLEALPEAVRDHEEILRARCMMALYHEGLSEDEVRAIHARWGELVARAIPPRRWPPGKPVRRLKVGFLSADFRNHAVAFVAQDVIRNLDRSAFEVHLIFGSLKPDQVTEAYSKLARLHYLREIPPQQMAAFIQNLKIDILIDLGGFTAGAMAGVMAYQPAPVQLWWAGYPFDPPYERIRYRLTDDLSDDPSPHVWRMPAPLETCAYFTKLGQIRAREEQRFTYATFANPMKFQPTMLGLWGQILQARPEARLLLKASSWSQAEAVQIATQRLTEAGAKVNQLHFQRGDLEQEDHLDTLNEVDLVLDTAPYNGTTTLFDCLAYGVSFVTLRGQSHRSRVGAMMATVLGEQDCIARTGPDYVEKALAARTQTLADREARQARFLASDLQNGPKMAEKFGEALQAIWDEHCDQA